MISRNLYIKGSSIDDFAELIGIKHFLSFNDMGRPDIDFSFYEKEESWFFYDEVQGEFDYFLDLNIYVDEDTFFELISRASEKKLVFVFLKIQQFHLLSITYLKMVKF